MRGRGYIQKCLYIRGNSWGVDEGYGGTTRRTLEPKRRCGTMATAAGVRLYIRMVSAVQCARAFSFCIGPLIYSVHPSCCRCSGGSLQFLNLKTVSLIVVIANPHPLTISWSYSFPSVGYSLRTQATYCDQDGNYFLFFLSYPVTQTCQRR